VIAEPPCALDTGVFGFFWADSNLFLYIIWSSLCPPLHTKHLVHSRVQLNPWRSYQISHLWHEKAPGCSSLSTMIHVNGIFLVKHTRRGSRLCSDVGVTVCFKPLVTLSFIEILFVCCDRRKVSYGYMTRVRQPYTITKRCDMVIVAVYNCIVGFKKSFACRKESRHDDSK
jgi:hypothetical protein